MILLAQAPLQNSGASKPSIPLPAGGPALQVTLPEQPGFQLWQGLTLWTQPGIQQAELRRMDRTGKAVTFRTPLKFLLHGERHGVLYGTRYDRETKRTWTVSSRDARSWSDGPYLTGPMRLGYALPLDEGRWFLKAILSPFSKEGRNSFYAIARPREDGQFEVLELVQVGLPLWPEGSRTKCPLDGLRAEGMPWWVDLMAGVVDTCMVGDHIVTVLRRTGTLLVFNAQTGHFRRRIDVLPQIHDREHAKKAKEGVILGWRPSDTGNLWLVTRSEDAVLNALSIFGAEAQAPSRESEAEALLGRHRKAREKALEAFRDLWWWEFDPDQGSPARRSPPPSMPEKLMGLKDYETFEIWMTSKGRLGRTY